MHKLRFVVSLTTRDNGYQLEQAAVAEHTANRLESEVEIVYAENVAVLQSQQLLQIIQSSTSLTAGIIFEPVGDRSSAGGQSGSCSRRRLGGLESQRRLPFGSAPQLSYPGLLNQI
jgi:hypothetical protein